jgi:hypothetical protein
MRPGPDERFRRPAVSAVGYNTQQEDFMARHVRVSDRNGKHLSTFPVELGTDEAQIREEHYFEEARRMAREKHLITDEAEAQALRFEFATGPR